MSRRLAMFAAAAALTCSAIQAHADDAMLQYIPESCEITVIVDVEAAFAEPQIANLLSTQVSPQIEAEGFPALSEFKSVALGIDLQDGNFQAQPFIYAAVNASSSLANLESQMASAMSQKTVAERPMFYSNDAAVTFSNDKMMLLAGTTTDQVVEMMDASAGANASTKPGFAVGGGFLDNPVAYVHATGMAPLMQQVMPMALMGMQMQLANAPPEARQQVSAMQGDLMALSNLDTLEVALGFSRSEAIFGLRFHMPSEGESGKVSNMFNTLKSLAEADPQAAQQMRGLSIQMDGNACSVRFAMPKDEFLAQIGMAMMMMMMSGGGGGY